MKAPLNRRVFVVGYGAATPLGKTFDTTWQRAVNGEAGFRRLTRFRMDSGSAIVGEIPDWDPMALDFMAPREAYNWNAGYVFLTMAVCKEALLRSGLEINHDTGPRTACLIGSALNGTDAFRVAMDNYVNRGPMKVSPYLLPNLCANLPSSKAGILTGFTGPIFSPQGACASGNHAIGIGARMIRDGDCDFALVGGVDYCLLPEIIQGFANMLASIYVGPKDRAHNDPTQASRPFSVDRRGIVLSEGAGVLVLAAEEKLSALGLTPKAEVMGIGWTSDAHHFTLPNAKTIIRAIQEAIQRRRPGTGRHRLCQRAWHIDPEGRQDRNRVSERGIRQKPGEHTGIFEQVPDRTHPGGFGRDRGRAGDRGDAAGADTADGEPYSRP